MNILRTIPFVFAGVLAVLAPACPVARVAPLTGTNIGGSAGPERSGSRVDKGQRMESVITKVVPPAKDGTLSLIAAEAEIQGIPAEAASPPAPIDAAPPAKPLAYLNLKRGTRLLWKAAVEPGVYNVMVRYEAPDAVPAIRLRLGDGRELQDTFVKSIPGKELGFQSLGPLPFAKSTVMDFELSQADAAGAGAIAVAEVILQPIGGALSSVMHGTLTGPYLQKAAPRANPKDDAEMVRVPAGEFIMGGLSGKADAHPVVLQEYWIYKYPVTVRQYRRFCEGTKRQMPPPPRWGWINSYPMVNVSWFDALAYAKWAGVRLPTEAEWEKAGRGVDGRVLPWGNNFDTAKCQSPRDMHGFQGTTPVGWFPANVSPFGCRDMAGNVWQWCSTRIGPYPYRADDGREDIETHVPGERRTYRGGGWVMNSWRTDWTILHRGNFFPKYPDSNGNLVEVTRDHIGFRCAVSVSPSGSNAKQMLRRR